VKDIKFDTVKEKAAAIYADAFARSDFAPYGSEWVAASAATLLPFVRASSSAREEMKVFAEAFEAPQGDSLAFRAKEGGGAGDLAAEWYQVVLRAREAGLELIQRWDVRQAGRLIELFPGCAPAGFRGKPLSAYLADNENSDWMVGLA
jgi:hypothetical protein